MASPGNQLRERREALGISQYALAERADVALKTVQNIESGRGAKPWKRTLHPIARVLLLEPQDADWLFGIEPHTVDVSALTVSARRVRMHGTPDERREFARRLWIVVDELRRAPQ